LATWQKSDPEVVQRFLASLPLTQGVERRQMFGYPCAFINGNMFAGLHEQRLIVRVPSEAASRPFEVMGTVMREYVAVENALECPPAEFSEWIARGLAYTRTLPPKKAQAKTAPKSQLKAADRKL
jgi:TfoX/Sxy family transcriptional regulator of competence genes